MKIGGQMWLADQANKARHQQRTEMNRRAYEQHLSASRSFGQNIFSANVTHGQQSVQLTLQVVNDRIQRQIEAQFSSSTSLLSAFSGSVDRKV